MASHLDAVTALTLNIVITYSEQMVRDRKRGVSQTPLGLGIPFPNRVLAEFKCKFR